MLSSHELTTLSKFLTEIENVKIINDDGKEITLKELAEKRTEETRAINREKISPVKPVVYTAVAIRTRVNVAINHREHFFNNFPEINTLTKLKERLDTTDPKVFLSTYLNINSKIADASLNPKYSRLKNLCEGFLEYKVLNNFSSDIDAILDWANKVDVDQLESDIIGRRKGIGPATVQNIQLTLMLDKVKGDVNVLNLLKDIIGRKVKAEQVGEIASQLGKSEIYLDTLLFQYGRIKYQGNRNSRS